MPRFQPTVDEAGKALPKVLVDAAAGESAFDETRLAPAARLLLALIRRMLSAGVEKETIISGLGPDTTGGDARIASALHTAFESFDLKTARVFCIVPEFDNDAMWAHYAEDHTGMVLGFRHIPALDTPLLAARAVSYSAAPPVVGTGLDFWLYGDTPDLRTRTLNAVCFTKKAAWSYEKEWRVLTWRATEGGAQFGDYRFYSTELESLTLGLRITPEAEDRVRSLIAEGYPQCSVYRMVIQQGTSFRIAV